VDVSIAMATYNGEKYLPAQLDSLARQTLLPCELVVSDDASSDATLEVLEEFRKRAPFRVTILANTERLRYSDNFWRAVRRCGGDGIAFCDQDDVWAPAKLERCVAELRDPQIGLVYHAYEEVDADLRPLGIVFPRLGSPRIVRPSSSLPISLHAVAGCGIVARRNVTDVVLRYWPREHAAMVGRLGTGMILAYDYVTFYAAHALTSVVLLPTPLVKHRRHGWNTSGVGPQRWKGNIKQALATGADAYRRWSEVLRLQAQLFAAMATDDSSLSRAFRRLADEVQDEAHGRLRRAELYETPTRTGRLLLWWTMVHGGEYRHPAFGCRSAVKDLVVSLGTGSAARRTEHA
jgi:glycosyltransferase involved in cell wall biosynthesis